MNLATKIVDCIDLVDELKDYSQLLDAIQETPLPATENRQTRNFFLLSLYLNQLEKISNKLEDRLEELHNQLINL